MSFEKQEHKPPSWPLNVAFNHNLWAGARWHKTLGQAQCISGSWENSQSSQQFQGDYLLLEDTIPLPGKCRKGCIPSSVQLSISKALFKLWGRWAGPAARASLGLVLLPPFWTHPKSCPKHLAMLLPFFPRHLKTGGEKRQQTAWRALWLMVFRLAESLERL